MMEEYIQLLNSLFTPKQQMALFIITSGVMAMTQGFKNIYFGFCPMRNKNKTRAILWSAAMSFGFIGGVLGYLIGEPPQPLWFWVFCGISSGATAIGLYKLIIELLLPRCITYASKKMGVGPKP